MATAPGVKQVFKFFVAKWSKYFLHLMDIFPGGRWQASQKYARFYDLWSPRLRCARKASKKREIGDKIRAFWMQPKKTCKMVETFSALWRDAELEGVILGSWLEKKTNKMGQASWADRNRGCIIALFLAIRLWRSCKNSNEITRDPNEYLFSQISQCRP